MNEREREAVVPLGGSHCNGIGAKRKYNAPVDVYRRAAAEHVFRDFLQIAEWCFERIGMKHDPRTTLLVRDCCGKRKAPVLYATFNVLCPLSRRRE